MGLFTYNKENLATFSIMLLITRQNFNGNFIESDDKNSSIHVFDIVILVVSDTISFFSST